MGQARLYGLLHRHVTANANLSILLAIFQNFMMVIHTQIKVSRTSGGGGDADR